MIEHTHARAHTHPHTYIFVIQTLKVFKHNKEPITNKMVLR